MRTPHRDSQLFRRTRAIVRRICPYPTVHQVASLCRALLAHSVAVTDAHGT